jgi:hypothetical protein
LEAPDFAGAGRWLPFHPHLQPLLGFQVAAGDCPVRELEIPIPIDEAPNRGAYGFCGFRPAIFI